MKEQIVISEFRKIHNISDVKFARLRAKAEKLNPGVVITRYHYEGRHNHNVLIRPDLIEAILPPPKYVKEQVNLNDLYARIASLEAEMSTQKKARKRPVAKRRSELSRALGSEV